MNALEISNDTGSSQQTTQLVKVGGQFRSDFQEAFVRKGVDGHLAEQAADGLVNGDGADNNQAIAAANAAVANRGRAQSGKPIEIHEFSTGIDPGRTEDGGWISYGFTGEFMNSTFGESGIPSAVQEAISRRDFECERPEQGGLITIGRVVDDEWAVVAYVSRGQDEKGRSGGFYRYFLTNDTENGIESILAFNQQPDRDPRFNPFPQDFSASPHLFHQTNLDDGTEKIEELQEDGQQERTTVLSPNGEQSATAVHRMATTAARKDNQPVAWVHNASGIEKPERFQLILPANDLFSQQIQKTLNRRRAQKSDQVDFAKPPSEMNHSEIKEKTSQIFRLTGKSPQSRAKEDLRSFVQDYYNSTQRQEQQQPQSGRAGKTSQQSSQSSRPRLQQVYYKVLTEKGVGSALADSAAKALAEGKGALESKDVRQAHNQILDRVLAQSDVPVGQKHWQRHSRYVKDEDPKMRLRIIANRAAKSGFSEEAISNLLQEYSPEVRHLRDKEGDQATDTFVQTTASQAVRASKGEQFKQKKIAKRKDQGISA